MFFWSFFNGLWRVFNGNAVESFVGPRDQSEDAGPSIRGAQAAAASWEATAQASAVAAVVESGGVTAPAEDAADGMAM